ncbi:hypothetical protein LO762_08310 [Actinocorallia sp. API 0066]|uniref:hypothetical protein n=1 Tax=Actinocorallia sp. API 0066 TaxID=2896846 RepID=UPI001E37E500|nr:hypothetical protein [Actinocorallia sp. API 0066]MCD0449189.1 hypothetical protein [Actinocorallia sp. API 0066]
MAVRYINVSSTMALAPEAVRATGNVAVIGAATSGTDDVPVPVANSEHAAELFGPARVPDPQDPKKTVPNSALTAALATLFVQTPGPGQVWAVKTVGDTDRSVTNPSNALAEVGALDVQFVVLAGTPLTTASGEATGAIGQLAAHVTEISNNGGDGKERMGVAMLAKGSANPAVVQGKLVSDRMIYIAHNSDEDAAAAVAGTVAGYPPHVSMLLKRVAITSAPFTSLQIDQLNDTENWGDPPKGKGINWLVDPTLIPGGGIHLGEGYTGDPGGKKFIDVQRTVDDLSFRLKARLIRAVGDIRVSRSGLRALTVQLESALEPLVRDGVIEGYTIDIPVLTLLDGDPTALTPAQHDIVQRAQVERIIQILVTVDYAGAIHRIALKLTFA